MNSKHKFGESFRDKKLDIEKQRALEFNDTGEGDMGYTRCDILEAIQHLLIGSYQFNFNPLPQLRKFFPRLEWEYHCFENIEDDDLKCNKAIKKMIASSDFFWPTHTGSDLCWVTATRKDKIPARMRIFGRGSINVSYDRYPEYRKFLVGTCKAKEAIPGKMDFDYGTCRRCQ